MLKPKKLRDKNDGHTPEVAQLANDVENFLHLTATSAYHRGYDLDALQGLLHQAVVGAVCMVRLEARAEKAKAKEVAK